jgi:SAM-dependent MidA family methyltransferase
LSADVDFSALAKIAAQQHVGIAGPVGQGEFLARLGLERRLEALLSQPHITNEKAQSMVNAAERLVLPQHMGSKYKAMAIFSTDISRPIAGFGK